jgi:hypothetical protein
MRKIDKPRLFIIITAVLFLITGGISLFHQNRLMQMSGGLTVLDMHLSYSSEEASDLFNNLGPAGRESYIAFLLLDFIFIIFFALIQYFIMAYLLKKVSPDSKWQKLAYLPYIRGAFDALENLFILLMLFYFPDRMPVMAGAANLSTILKWLSMSVIMAVALGGGIMLTWKSIFHKEVKANEKTG